jgi:hypothetical protein
LGLQLELLIRPADRQVYGKGRPIQNSPFDRRTRQIALKTKKLPLGILIDKELQEIDGFFTCFQTGGFLVNRLCAKLINNNSKIVVLDVNGRSY